MERIDVYPTRQIAGFPVRVGTPFPFGATLVPGGVNFSVFSRYATACTLVLFNKDESAALAEIPFPEDFRIGNVFCMIVFGLEVEKLEYGFRMDGPCSPHEGHRFDYRHILLDPYAKAISGRDTWAENNDPANPYQFRGRLVFDDFDWEGDRPLETPIEDLVIYEMHVRGFTRHPSSAVKHPGTFAALREKIPYLKELGINCVELMPICEFDELEYQERLNPETGVPLVNYWGYSSVGFFAPKSGFAATGKFGMQVDEFKTLVKELHRNGIEIILDVVFNHTAEGDERGATISFRGIDNKTYYMLTPDGRYLNFSGTGNTMNCNNPIVRSMVIDCLRHWAAQYHIDGFRFDLASILGRDQDGHPLRNPPLLETMAYDPVLAKCKLIAEAWDAGGLYQVGSFPAYGRWAEWNGKYRDTLRRFLKSDYGQTHDLAARLLGSPDLYANRGPGASINFITCHDGFTLNDLFSYNDKHNLANGEQNNDGANDNYSWNCGCEGPSDDPAIRVLRRRLVKNALTLLMVSQGVPMILMGDEIAHTKYGNNNTYCHDNTLNWFDWTLLDTNSSLFQFFQRLIAFRHLHPVLRSQTHLQHRDYVGSGYPDISWHGTQAWKPEWQEYIRTLAFMLCGKHSRGGTLPDDYLYVAANAHWETHRFEMPALPAGMYWYLFVDTAADETPEPGYERLLRDQRYYQLSPRTVLVLVGK
ncbi:MAG: glycogen debranching protein GlgX [Chloroflexi bacterium]|nr:glycogen debranching protein GlgX [Chloroflexota bacterium]